MAVVLFIVGGFLAVAAHTGLPLRTFEVGASAGLNLRWDRFFYEARGATWGPPLVARGAVSRDVAGKISKSSGNTIGT